MGSEFARGFWVGAGVLAAVLVVGTVVGVFRRVL
jgi:hypothetical protein